MKTINITYKMIRYYSAEVPIEDCQQYHNDVYDTELDLTDNRYVANIALELTDSLHYDFDPEVPDAELELLDYSISDSDEPITEAHNLTDVVEMDKVKVNQ